MLRDLLEHPVDVDQDVAGADLDEPAVRRVMIRAEQLERDIADTKRLKGLIAEDYDRQIEALEEQLAWARSSVQAFVERHGQARFPDVGTAYLAHQEPKIEIVDKDEFKAATGGAFVKETFDETAAKKYALERALAVGEIVPGTRLVPGGPGLRIRKA